MPLRFCDCGSQCAITEQDLKLGYKCLKCTNVYPVEGVYSLLFQEYCDVEGSTFDSILKSAPFDPTNLRKAIQCSQCFRQVQTFMQVGKKSESHLLCKCGSNQVIGGRK